MPLGAARFGLSGADLGKLELIETQTMNSTSIEFTSIKESIYNVHFLTFNDIDVTTTGDNLRIRVSNDGGTTYENTNYQRAHQTFSTTRTSGTGESKSTADTSMITTNLGGTDTNSTVQGYAYLYNLGDSGKYSFHTMHSISYRDGDSTEYRFGSGVYTVAETINAIKIFSNDNTTVTGSVSLYGIKES